MHTLLSNEKSNSSTSHLTIPLKESGTACDGYLTCKADWRSRYLRVRVKDDNHDEDQKYKSPLDCGIKIAYLSSYCSMPLSHIMLSVLTIDTVQQS